MSPLLRNANNAYMTHAHHHHHQGSRSPATTPDILHEYDRLPPLEAVRVSMGNPEMTSEARVGVGGGYSPRVGAVGGYVAPNQLQSRPSSYTEELKPLVKYSPDVKGNYEKHVVNMC